MNPIIHQTSYQEYITNHPNFLDIKEHDVQKLKCNYIDCNDNNENHCINILSKEIKNHILSQKSISQHVYLLRIDKHLSLKTKLNVYKKNKFLEQVPLQEIVNFTEKNIYKFNLYQISNNNIEKAIYTLFQEYPYLNHLIFITNREIIDQVLHHFQENKTLINLNPKTNSLTFNFNEILKTEFLFPFYIFWGSADYGHLLSIQI